MKRHLTEKQKNNPHKAAANVYGYEGLSVLERSFLELRFDEIDMWTQSGVLKEAMSGSSSSRRQYVRTLMSCFLLGMSKINAPAGAKPKFDEVINTLWKLGAANQNEQFPAWLLCAPTNAFMKRLLDLGANPHTESILKFNRNQVLSIEPLLKKLLNLESRALRQSIYCAEDQNVIDQEIDDLVLIVDRIIKTPGASQNVLDKNLGLITLYAFEGAASPAQKDRWKSWRDALLSQGAAPSFVRGGALGNLCFASPKQHMSLEDWAYARRKYADKEDMALIAAQFAEQAEADWRERSIEWMQTLTSTFIERNKASCAVSQPSEAANASLDQHGWERLISLPNGFELARELMKTSIDFPWESAGGGRQSGFNYLPSKPAVILNRFALLLEGAPIHKEWSRAMAGAYIERTRPSGRWRGGQDAVLTQGEVLDLFKISRMVKGDQLDQWMHDLVAKMPSIWNKSAATLDDRRKMVQTLDRADVWHNIFDNPRVNFSINGEDMSLSADFRGWFYGDIWDETGRDDWATPLIFHFYMRSNTFASR